MLLKGYSDTKHMSSSRSSNAAHQVDLTNLVDAIKNIQDVLVLVDYVVDETRTRTALIDPILKAVGWDPTQPNRVIPEYSVDFGSGIVDYALLGATGNAGDAVAFVEAKRNADPLTDSHREQLLRYAQYRRSVRLAILTNGDVWEFYTLTSQRQFVSVSIRDTSAEQCATIFQELFEELSGSTEVRSNDSDSSEYSWDSVPWQNSSTGVRVVVDDDEIIRPLPFKSIFIWIIASFVVAIPIGYAIGFQAAQPTFGTYGRIGLLAFVCIFIGSIGFFIWKGSWAVLTHRVSYRVSRISRHLSREDIWPTDTKNHRLIGFALVAAVIGGFGGFILGNATAQSIADLMAFLGFIIVILVAAAILWLAFTIYIKSKRRTGGRRNTRGRRRRRSR